ncbi:hypothetical protein NQZ68_016194 [Dissostichus eleginoides]|nr:hypothetical protein NQZ68_016194 [Dissostichus eleginoides]
MLDLAGYLNTNEKPEDGPEMHHVDRPNKDSSRGAAGGDSVGHSSTAFSTRKSVLVTSCGFPRCMAALRHAIASVRTHPPSGHRHRCKSSFLALLFVKHDGERSVLESLAEMSSISSSMYLLEVERYVFSYAPRLQRVSAPDSQLQILDQ